MAVHFPLWDQMDHVNFEQYWQDTLPRLQNTTNNSSSSNNKTAAKNDLCSTSTAAPGRPFVVLFGDRWVLQ